MRALIVTPGTRKSARVTDVAEPTPDEGAVLCEMVAVGVCGTDHEILAAEHGEAPAGEDDLILGHESLGRVAEAPADSGFKSGDLVVAMVRRPDPAPCRFCAVGEWDMCSNGGYTEHGIKGVHGFCRERWRVDADRLVRVDPDLGLLGVLLEPTSVLVKAWEHIVKIGARARFEPRRALITGAGPIGLLAALLAAARGLEVHVLDRATEGLTPDLVRTLGATYHGDPAGLAELDADVVVECTGVPDLVLSAMTWAGPAGIVCLTGVSPCGRKQRVDVGGLGRSIVLDNRVVFGTVNANRRHYEGAARALARADRGWLERLITRRVALAYAVDALADSGGDDIKTVILGPGAA